jgi:flagellar biosynthesis/type III secretory pathway chaperone
MKQEQHNLTANYDFGSETQSLWWLITHFLRQFNLKNYSLIKTNFYKKNSLQRETLKISEKLIQRWLQKKLI